MWLCAANAESADAVTAAPKPLTLDDLYAELSLPDAAMSPSGRYIAAIVRDPAEDRLVVIDLDTSTSKAIRRAGRSDAGRNLSLKMVDVSFKDDDRLLVRLRVSAAPSAPRKLHSHDFEKQGERLIAVDRASGAYVSLLLGNRSEAVWGARNLGAIASHLPDDPDHILLVVTGMRGSSLLKVNLNTGAGVVMEPPSESVVDWWLGLDGNPVVRISESLGTLRFYRRDADRGWRLFQKRRVQEHVEPTEYSEVGPSNDPGKHFLLARPPGRDRVGLYLYDVDQDDFGAPIVEHPVYDIASAAISRDGTRVLSYCYSEHVWICESPDAGTAAHLQGLRRYFRDSANVTVHGAADDGASLLLKVDGPHDPPAFFYYRAKDRSIESLGSMRKSLDDVARPSASVVTWTTRDGKKLDGYLTLPPGVAGDPDSLPLIVHPHGGPAARDLLTFDPWVQYLAARGFAVFQPNFRGSAGYGHAFMASGHGQWGGAMQNDVTDGVEALIGRGMVDASRICIVGASYGGYAALVGAAQTPDLYRCAVSIAGVTDLPAFIHWRKMRWGSDSEGYRHWLVSIGDPDRDESRLLQVSPAKLAQRIRIPVLLIHGKDDFIVPVSQSRQMHRALVKSGNPARLVELDHVGHAFTLDTHREVLELIAGFLEEQLIRPQDAADL